MKQTKNLGGGIAYLDDKGAYHKEDGPALIYPDDHDLHPGYKGWFLHGVQIGCNQQQWVNNHTRLIKTNEEFLRIIKLKIFW